MLKSFIAVATLQNFSSAARKLNTVQPAISRHISDLEEELGVKLFWRTTREVKITPAGLSLLKDAQAMLQSEDEAKERARRAAKGEIGRLRIGYLPSACFSFLPDLVRAYAEQYPEVHIRLIEMSAQEQIDGFAEGTIDVGFSRPLPQADLKSLTVKEIYEDTLLAVLPERHSLSKKQRIHLRQLENESFVLYNRTGAVGLFDQIISACVTNQFTPRITSQPGNMQTVLTEVAAGLGVSIVPGCIRHLHTKGCTFLSISKWKPSIPLQIHYRTEPTRPIDDAFVTLALQKKSKIRKLAL